MKFGEVMRQQREIQGLSEEEVADRLGLELDAYRALESGVNRPFESAAGQVLRFAELLGGQVNQLFYPCGIPFETVKRFDVSP